MANYVEILFMTVKILSRCFDEWTANIIVNTFIVLCISLVTFSAVFVLLTIIKEDIYGYTDSRDRKVLVDALTKDVKEIVDDYINSRDRKPLISAFTQREDEIMNDYINYQNR